MTSRWQEPLSPKARKILEAFKRGKDPTAQEALEICPYRTLFGGGETLEEKMKNCRSFITILDMATSDISPHMMDDIVAAVLRGESVMLMAARREDRDHAKTQIERALGLGTS